MSQDHDALEYHRRPRPGKTEVVATKPCITQRDLSLAYTPGVALPCLHISEREDDVFRYTNRGNLVAVVSNGTAVLGLGNIGPLASKPVMEGKAVLFKRFAGVDVFDLELDTTDPKRIIETCELLAPTFGGINLEDIRAPECFAIEEALQERLDIPVFHDDQHGTAIISGAALLNALELVEKDIANVRVVFSGAGAAGIACAKFYEQLGVAHEHILLCDSTGVLHHEREDLDEGHPRYNPYKAYFAQHTDARTLADALRDADVFAGVSAADLVTREMVATMAEHPIVFAMANPDPEISYEEAKAARPDVIVATGRSDYPNQINNVLGFPFIFRGALDVRARGITEGMKVAAAQALARLAREDVPDVVLRAYQVERMKFGPDYLIPKPFDPRVLTCEALAVARAAVEEGVARDPIEDWDAYRDQLEKFLGAERETMRRLVHRAQRRPARIVFAEGDDDKVLRAAQIILDEGIGTPILLGAADEIEARREEIGLTLDGARVVDPARSPLYDRLVDRYHRLRCRKGSTRDDAMRHLRRRVYFGAMMVREGNADVFIAGRTRYYARAVQPMLRVLSDRVESHTIASVHLAIKDGHHFFLADTGVNEDPGVEELADIAENVHALATDLGIQPRIALLSSSNFGSAPQPSSDKMRQATELLWRRHPHWCVDGEMQADVAVRPDLLEADYPFSTLKGGANCLVFPSLDAANIAFRLLESVGGVTLVGPLLCGLGEAMHILQRSASAQDIANIAAVGAVQAQQSRPEVAAASGRRATGLGLSPAASLVSMGDGASAFD